MLIQGCAQSNAHIWALHLGQRRTSQDTITIRCELARSQVLFSVTRQVSDSGSNSLNLTKGHYISPRGKILIDFLQVNNLKY